MGTFGALIIPK